jgi:hypothetical protein
MCLNGLLKEVKSSIDQSMMTLTCNATHAKATWPAKNSGVGD